jgi:predicted TIM-barrel fold metal-dependent hydrolase
MVFLISFLSGFVNVAASDLYFVDAHSQVDHKLKNLGLIIRRMDQAGVYCSILAARSERKSQGIASFSREYADRIIPSVRTKSSAYNNNTTKYFKKMRRQIDSGQFKAMAEVLLYHARKGNKAPEVIVYPNDKRVLFALKEAVKHRWPFVIHIEFQALAVNKRKGFMAAMEEMLEAHPKHPFALNHLGQLDTMEVRRLIEGYDNIYFLTAHTNPFIIRHSNQPWINMFQGERLAPHWMELLLEYPSRFIFALDNVWIRHWGEFYLGQMAYWRKAMIGLPPKVAHALAHGNAERLWKIKPKAMSK